MELSRAKINVIQAALKWFKLTGMWDKYNRPNWLEAIVKDKVNYDLSDIEYYELLKLLDAEKEIVEQKSKAALEELVRLGQESGDYDLEERTKFNV